MWNAVQYGCCHFDGISYRFRGFGKFLVLVRLLPRRFLQHSNKQYNTIIWYKKGQTQPPEACVWLSSVQINHSKYCTQGQNNKHFQLRLHRLLNQCKITKASMPAGQHQTSYQAAVGIVPTSGGSVIGGQHPSIISCCLKISLNSPLSSVALLKLYKLLWFGNEHSHGKEFIKARNNGNVGQGPVVVSLPAFTNSTASSVSKASTTSRSLRLGQPCWRINSGGFPVHGTRRPPEA